MLKFILGVKFWKNTMFTKKKIRIRTCATLYFREMTIYRWNLEKCKIRITSSGFFIKDERVPHFNSKFWEKKKNLHVILPIIISMLPHHNFYTIYRFKILNKGNVFKIIYIQIHIHNLPIYTFVNAKVIALPLTL